MGLIFSYIILLKYVQCMVTGDYTDANIYIKGNNLR